MIRNRFTNFTLATKSYRGVLITVGQTDNENRVKRDNVKC